MHGNETLRQVRFAVLLTGLVSIAATGFAAAPGQCAKVILDGDVSAAREWNAPIGEGWLFRIVPIPPLAAGYSGWDLVVDRENPAGFPDALYLATPPYRSINEREIGATFGLRAQDAIGWNPRSFRFLVDPAAFHQAQRTYRAASAGANPGSPPPNPDSAMTRLFELQKHAARGELRIVDAHVVPGVADPAPFALQWARAASRLQYEVEAAPEGKSSPRGSLLWIRFRISLWLPPGWALPAGLHSVQAPCGE